MKNKLKLMGAKKFLHMPKGTYYIEHWMNGQHECIEVVDKFMKDPESLLNWANLQVYGSNDYSMCFWDEHGTFKETNNIEDIMFIVDINVVGDAGPGETLYLVLDEDWIPDEIIDMNCNKNISREDVIRAHDKFIEDSENLDNINNPDNEWAWDQLTNGRYKDSWVVNYDSEVHE